MKFSKDFLDALSNEFENQIFEPLGSKSWRDDSNYDAEECNYMYTAQEEIDNLIKMTENEIYLLKQKVDHLRYASNFLYTRI